MANATYSGADQPELAPDYARYDRIWQRVAPAMNPYPAVRAENTATLSPPRPPEDTAAAELRLPGAEANPCCMGTEAQEMTQVIEGFAQEEGADASTYRQLSRFAPSRLAVAALRELGRMSEQRARELSAAYFLITGEQKNMETVSVVLPRLPYRELLRDRYHAAACNGLNYARAADGTEDPCLVRLLQRFSRENYEAAERLLRLLAQVS